MKKLIITLVTISGLAFTSPALAEEQICTTQYGGGVVCGVKTPELKKTGLGDINMSLIGAAFIIGSGVIYFKNRRAVAR